MAARVESPITAGCQSATNNIKKSDFNTDRDRTGKQQNKVQDCTKTTMSHILYLGKTN